MPPFEHSESGRATTHALGDLIRRLRDLILALDGRAPRTGHASEPAIARDAAVLRQKAVQRLADLSADAKAVPDGPPERVNP